MTEERNDNELTAEEIERVEAEQLPDREQMSVILPQPAPLPVVDPADV